MCPQGCERFNANVHVERAVNPGRPDAYLLTIYLRCKDCGEPFSSPDGRDLTVAAVPHSRAGDHRGPV